MATWRRVTNVTTNVVWCWLLFHCIGSRSSCFVAGAAVSHSGSTKPKTETATAAQSSDVWPQTAEEFVLSQKEALLRVLDDVLVDTLLPTKATPFAMLDFPMHPNFGDSAIWAGEIAYLVEKNRAALFKDQFYPAYQFCDKLDSTMQAHANKTGIPPKQWILLSHGGGNFGDVWLSHNNLRLGVLQRYKDFKWFIFPQSINFDNAATLQHTEKTLGSLPKDITLLVRDKHSYNLATEHFANSKFHVYLTPDMAFMLGPIHLLDKPVIDVLWVARTDKESKFKTLPINVTTASDVKVVDWLKSEDGQWTPEWDTLANIRAMRGFKILRQGRVVVSDRLHGLIMALLLGIPHVFIDNNNEKLTRYHETWTYKSPITWTASSPGEALSIARMLAATIKAGEPLPDPRTKKTTAPSQASTSTSTFTATIPTTVPTKAPVTSSSFSSASKSSSSSSSSRTENGVTTSTTTTEEVTTTASDHDDAPDEGTGETTHTTVETDKDGQVITTTVTVSVSTKQEGNNKVTTKTTTTKVTARPPAHSEL